MLHKNIAIALVSIMISSASYGWGWEGHKMTAAIAYEHLSKNTKDSLKAYLGDMTIEQASTWMDDIKKDTTLDYLKPLHYINIEPGQAYDPQSQGNIISELNKVIAALKDRNHHSKQETAMDIKILIHLVGDLHQPLHVGYGADRGGNNIKLTVLGDSSNLHRVWDSEIIKRKHIYAADLEKELAKGNIGETDKIDIIQWMNESRSELKAVYNYHDNINQQYLDANEELVEKLLIRSGLRIASLLNSLFK